MTYDSSFSSSCASIDKIPAITAYSGHSVGDVYDKASEYNMTFVGAADPSVGLGGYLTGGGHSPLGSEYGMASDNVLQLSLVTPTGQVLTANPCQNTDLFWAMRGVSRLNIHTQCYMAYHLKTGGWSNFWSLDQRYSSRISYATTNLCEVRF
jgi:FAD/FMN-containing dehydrogenase